MILHLSGEIRLSGWDYPQDTTRFHVDASSRIEQHGASAERIAATAPLVEAIAGLVTDWNAGRGRFAPKPKPEHIRDMEGEHFAITV